MVLDDFQSEATDAALCEGMSDSRLLNVKSQCWCSRVNNP